MIVAGTKATQVGIMTRAENNRTVSTAVLVESAAAPAGVTCGSLIVAVNGRDVSSEPHDNIMTAIINGSRPLVFGWDEDEREGGGGADSEDAAGCRRWGRHR